jgi:hypothetical protein
VGAFLKVFLIECSFNMLLMPDFHVVGNIPPRRFDGLTQGTPSA